jgi:hypothetical protein
LVPVLKRRPVSFDFSWHSQWRRGAGEGGRRSSEVEEEVEEDVKKDVVDEEASVERDQLESIEAEAGS